MALHHSSEGLKQTMVYPGHGPSFKKVCLLNVNIKYLWKNHHWRFMARTQRNLKQSAFPPLVVLSCTEVVKISWRLWQTFTLFNSHTDFNYQKLKDSRGMVFRFILWHYAENIPPAYVSYRKYLQHWIQPRENKLCVESATCEGVLRSRQNIIWEV